MGKIEFHESNKGIFFERDLINSKAYMDLKGKSSQIFGIIMSRRKLTKNKIRGKYIFYLVNNGKIKLTYAEMQRKYGLSNYQFSRAIDELCDYGFIEVNPIYNETIPGYELNFTLIDNYKNYGTDNFKPGKRRKATTFFRKSEQKRDLKGRFIKKESNFPIGVYSNGYG